MNPETKREKELREKLRFVFSRLEHPEDPDIVAATVMDLLKAEGIMGEQE